MPVEKTNFTVGIVVAGGDKEEILSSQAIPSGILFSLVDMVGCGMRDPECGIEETCWVKR